MRLLQLLIALVAAVLICDLLYLMRGSLELYPTSEDDSKVRTVTIAIAAVLILVELALVFALRALRRQRSK